MDYLWSFRLRLDTYGRFNRFGQKCGYAQVTEVAYISRGRVKDKDLTPCLPTIIIDNISYKY